ncbi:hypothetical protein PV10_01640 [Exophiala mesophila]|uniref:Uncharacterized protein n=1 Tax=Exophiala mesophila TaxID=212818 RepID=A0A0D1ZVE7_EXOME|nr:uncharacterized protein PV10_01640 [Exophiala mesophila]KIV97944.1 hypothetical protein PV10_01640 [Exophiala mesophila]
MAEIVGAIASVLALCEVASGTLKRVAELRRAPTEINALLDEVNRIGQAIRAIESYTEVSIQPLQRCESLITDLNHIITTSIIRQGNDTTRIRRRNWLKNKRQVVQLYEKLEKERKILWEARCAELLSVPYIYSLLDEILTWHSRSSTRRVELTTDTIKNQSIRHDSRVLSIDKRLGNMEVALISQQSAKPYNAASSLPSSIFGRHDRFDVQSFSEKATSGRPADWWDNIVSKEEEPTQKPLFDAFHFADVCPELYTVRTGVPNLVQSYGGEISVSEYMRVYQFAFSYRQQPRKWIRFTLRVTISVESKHWNLQPSTAIGLINLPCRELPHSLMVRFEKMLMSLRGLDQNSCLTLFMGRNGEDVEGQEDDSIFSMKLSKPTFEMKEYLQKITRTIYHWGCPRYSDQQFDQRARFGHSPTNSFIVCLGARWVVATRFGPDQSSIDRDLYAMRSLHHLNGAPGITPFL